MGINSTEVSYGFGQLGSVYTGASSDAIKPPTNKIFIAITMLADTVFESSNGLVAEIPISNDIYIGTEEPAHDLADGSETTEEGSGGKVVDGITFPKGITIYGRWTKIDVLSGSVVAYIGE
tara:strand:- start:1241 stop:1603 length:363 start_codon:yes stop_codon:yes gene_type:complete